MPNAAAERTNVEVWCASLDPSPEEVSGCWEVLAPQERKRASKFSFERDRQRFVVARATLRRVLARYTGGSARDVVLRLGPYGKPALAGVGDGEPIEFNLAHSGELAAYAVARCSVGIDIEKVRPLDDLERMASSTFSLAEQATLLRLPREHHTLAFFNCWTRKEAYLKGRGLGLSRSLCSFDVSLAPGEPAALLAERLDPDEGALWRIVEFSPHAGFVGAVAARGQDVHLQMREL